MLTAQQFEQLEKQLIAPTVTTATTELLAGYQLGVADTLRRLRVGFVVPR